MALITHAELLSIVDFENYDTSEETLHCQRSCIVAVRSRCSDLQN